jgi:hypothetical protein
MKTMEGLTTEEWNWALGLCAPSDLGGALSMEEARRAGTLILALANENQRLREIVILAQNLLDSLRQGVPSRHSINALYHAITRLDI